MNTHTHTRDHPSVGHVLSGRVTPEDVLRRCGRTFHAASRIIPGPTRRDLALLYAFCRVVDDSVDDPAMIDGHASVGPLDAIERDLARGDSAYPLIRSFLALTERRDIPLLYARQLIEGVRSDMNPVDVRTQADLLRYAYRVASTVGLMMCRVMRVPHDGDPFAIDLGIAMQLTNIARDVREDHEQRRVYLPQTWIGRRTLADALVARHPEAVDETTNAVERLLSLADAYYDSADRGMRFLPAPVRPGIRAAARNYRAIGEVIRTAPAEALVSRVRTTPLTKLRGAGVSISASCLDALDMRRARHDERLHDAVEPLLITSPVA